MAKCKWCDNSGFFLFTDENGLCKKCSYKISSEANSVLRVVKDCAKLIEKSNKIETVISRSEVIINYLSGYSKYEKKGIYVFSQPVSVAIKESCKETDEKILSLISFEYDKSLEKISLAKSLNSKTKQANNFRTISETVIDYLKKRDFKNEGLTEKIITLKSSLDSALNINHESAISITKEQKDAIRKEKLEKRLKAKIEKQKEIDRLGALANKECFDEAMSSGEGIKKGWLTSGLPDTRESHVRYEKMGFVDMSYEYAPGLKYPGDPDCKDPDELEGCRCTIIYDVE